MYKPYAGIGSRSTPNDILELMKEIAFRLAREGWTLRSVVFFQGPSLDGMAFV
jgi:hypothetical protein